MPKNTVVDLAGRETITDPLTEILRAGAQPLIEKAVELELQRKLPIWTPACLQRVSMNEQP